MREHYLLDMRHLSRMTVTRSSSKFRPRGSRKEKERARALRRLFTGFIPMWWEQAK